MQVVGVSRVRWEQMVCGEKVGGSHLATGVSSSGVLLPFPVACVGQVSPPNSTLGLGWGWKQLFRLPWGGGSWSLGDVSWETALPLLALGNTDSGTPRDPWARDSLLPMEKVSHWPPGTRQELQEARL